MFLELAPKNYLLWLFIAFYNSTLLFPLHFYFHSISTATSTPHTSRNTHTARNTQQKGKMSLKEKAALIYSCLDLTSLEPTDTPETVAKLAELARIGSDLQVAALCIPVSLLSCSTLDFPTLATVVNFPQGNDTPDQVLQQVRTAIAAGAQEVDLVWPWQQQQQQQEKGTALVKAASSLCKENGGILLKVILETAAVSPEQTRLNALAAVEAGADFLKTSTGKLHPALTYHHQGSTGATLEAAQVLLEVAKQSDKVGVKISGGVKTLDQAWAFYDLACSELGALDKRRFRIGASSLARDLIRILSNQ